MSRLKARPCSRIPSFAVACDGLGVTFNLRELSLIPKRVTRMIILQTPRAQGMVGGGLWTVNDKRNLLRPEAAESLFVLWRVTHDEAYRDEAWHMFRAFEAYARIADGALGTTGNATVEEPAAQPADVAAAPDNAAPRQRRRIAAARRSALFRRASLALPIRARELNREMQSVADSSVASMRSAALRGLLARPGALADAAGGDFLRGRASAQAQRDLAKARGYASLRTVAGGGVPAPHEDHMESFFVSETLKYLLLIFSSDKVGFWTCHLCGWKKR